GIRHHRCHARSPPLSAAGGADDRHARRGGPAATPGGRDHPRGDRDGGRPTDRRAVERPRPMSILLTRESRVLVQGLTGREGSFHTEQMTAYGPKVVVCVRHGRGGT